MPVNVASPERVAARRLNLGGISMPVNVASPGRVAARRMNLGWHFNTGERRITRTRRVATDEFRLAFQCR